MPDFVKFDKIPRLNRPYAITEKLDGTNAQIHIYDDADELRHVVAGSRNRWITPGKTTDNHGFAAWVEQNEGELLKLGVGTHYGEWYGQGIARSYGLDHKRFALFNCDRWKDERPECCEVVSVMARPSNLRTLARDVDECLDMLRESGSVHVPGFMRPEGIVVFSYAGRTLWKVTLDNDELSKGEAEHLGLAA